MRGVGADAARLLAPQPILLSAAQLRGCKAALFSTPCSCQVWDDARTCLECQGMSHHLSCLCCRQELLRTHMVAAYNAGEPDKAWEEVDKLLLVSRSCCLTPCVPARRAGGAVCLQPQGALRAARGYSFMPAPSLLCSSSRHGLPKWQTSHPCLMLCRSWGTRTRAGCRQGAWGGVGSAAVPASEPATSSC